MLAKTLSLLFLLCASPFSYARSVSPIQSEEAAEEAPASYERFELPTQSEEVGAKELFYALRTPDAGDEPLAENAARPRVILALPPGDQSAHLADWISDAMAGSAFADCIIASPIAPTGQSFYADAKDLLPPFLDELERRFGMTRGDLHLVGVSNGGRSAMHLALNHPDRFASLAVLPGVLPRGEDEKLLPRLAHMPVAMWVGENDSSGWHEGAKLIVEKLEKAGGDASLRTVPGAGHVLPPSHWTEVRTHMDRADVTAVLDDFHDAAAKADLERYFGHFAPGAVFIGTDASERWPVKEFRAFCEPYFEGKDSAWVYSAFEREIDFAGANSGLGFAWFDEKLRNEKYGEVRGSGALVFSEGRWRITQYVLSFPVPNELAPDLAERIRASK